MTSNSESDVLQKKQPLPQFKTVTPGVPARTASGLDVLPLCMFMSKGSGLPPFKVTVFDEKFNAGEMAFVGLYADVLGLFVLMPSGKFDLLPSSVADKMGSASNFGDAERSDSMLNPRMFVVKYASRLALSGWQSVCSKDAWSSLRDGVVKALVEEGPLFTGLLKSLPLTDDLLDAARVFFDTHVTSKSEAAVKAVVKRKPAPAATKESKEPKKGVKRKLFESAPPPPPPPVKQPVEVKDVLVDSDSECEELKEPELKEPPKKKRVRTKPAEKPPLAFVTTDDTSRVLLLRDEPDRQLAVLAPHAAIDVFKLLGTIARISDDQIRIVPGYRTPAAWRAKPLLPESEFAARLASLDDLSPDTVAEITYNQYAPVYGFTAKPGKDILGIGSHIHQDVALDSIALEPVLVVSPQLEALLTAIMDRQYSPPETEED
jgi:hypothetical protein